LRNRQTITWLLQRHSLTDLSSAGHSVSRGSTDTSVYLIDAQLRQTLLRARDLPLCKAAICMVRPPPILLPTAQTYPKRTASIPCLPKLEFRNRMHWQQLAAPSGETRDVVEITRPRTDAGEWGGERGGGEGGGGIIRELWKSEGIIFGTCRLQKRGGSFDKSPCKDLLCNKRKR
jgi:hypothetical protein